MRVQFELRYKNQFRTGRSIPISRFSNYCTLVLGTTPPCSCSPITLNLSGILWELILHRVKICFKWLLSWPHFSRRSLFISIPSSFIAQHSHRTLFIASTYCSYGSSHFPLIGSFLAIIPSHSTFSISPDYSYLHKHPPPSSSLFSSSPHRCDSSS